MEDAGGGTGADQSARRRKIRAGRLQVFRRPARRGRQMRQRPFRMVQSRGFPRQPGLLHGLRARRDQTEAGGHRQIQEHRHAHHLQARPDHLHHHDRIQIRSAGQPAARTGLFESRAWKSPCRTSGWRTRRRSSSTGMASRNSCANWAGTRNCSIPNPSCWRGRRRKCWWIACCNTTTATPTRSSASPIPSPTPTAART